MAANRIHYGAAVMVGAGVLITGTLWFERKSERISGEDAAELLAAVTERRTVAYHTGYDEIVWETNTVREFAETAVFRGLILDGLRASATNEPAGDGIRIWWVAPPTPAIPFVWPEDGDEFATAETVWRGTATTNDSGSVYSDYVPDPASNAACAYLSTSTRVLDASLCWPGTDPTNLPLPLLMFAHADPDPPVMFPAGHWFTAVCTNELRAYKYGSERWVGTDGETIRVRAVAGDGSAFAVDPDGLFFGWYDRVAQAVGISGLAGDTNHMLSALYEVWGAGRNSAWFAVTDAETAGLSPNLVVSPRTLTVAEGGTSTFSVRPRDGILPGYPIRSVSLSAAGAVSVWPSTLLFGNNNWGTPQTVIVSAPDNALPGNSAGLIRLDYMGETAWLAVAVTGAADAGTPDLTAAANLVSVSKGGSGSVEVGAAVATNIRITASEIIRRADLDEARAGLTNLFRTVAWVPFDELVFTSSTETVWGVINEPMKLDYSAEATSEDLWGILIARLGESVAVEPNLSTHPVIASASLKADLSTSTLFWNTDPPYTSYDAEGYLWGSVTSRRYCGCSLPYPSGAAVRGGYVKKISVFAVAEGSVPSDEPQIKFVMSGSTNRTDDFTAHNIGPGGYDAVTLGAVSCLARHSDLVNPPRSNGTWDSTSYATDAGRSGVESIRLSHLMTVTDPSSRDDTVFGLGTDSLDDLSGSWAELPRGVQETVLYYDYYGDITTYGYDWVALNQTVSVLGFLVFVEWEWQHMARTPFAPTPHTPEWIIANTNAP